jgi:hypothetical protein
MGNEDERNRPLLTPADEPEQDPAHIGVLVLVDTRQEICGRIDHDKLRPVRMLPGRFEHVDSSQAESRHRFPRHERNPVRQRPQLEEPRSQHDRH